MGNCCAGPPTCDLGETERLTVAQIASEAVQRSKLPAVSIFVAKAIISSPANVPFDSLTVQVTKDNAPVNTYKVNGVDNSVFATVDQSTVRLVAGVVSEVDRLASNYLMTATLNLVKGGDAKDERGKRRAAEEAILKASRQAVVTEIEKILNSKREEIESFAHPSASRSGRDGGGGAPPNNSGAGNSTPTRYGSNNNANQQQQQQQPYPAPKNMMYAPPPQQQQQPQTPQQQKSPQQQQQQNGSNPPSPNSDPISSFNRNLANSYGMDPNNFTQEQVSDATPARHPSNVGGYYGEDPSPTNQAWIRYPLPEENGPWIRVNEAFFWSESAELYYFPAAGHFFHPESGMWHDPQQDRWMEEAEHEQLLDQMANMGLY
jgi:hypothetical protein